MNRVKLEFEARSENESLARVCVAAVATELNPTLEEINDIKTAVSEAVTNAVIHGYDEKGGSIILDILVEENTLTVTVTDFGRGIRDIRQAMEPFYTTGSDSERSGMGFTFMEVFMDELKVESIENHGTVIRMSKTIGVGNN